MTNLERLESQIIEALKTIYDPELPVNIYDLGLIYRIVVRSPESVHIEMTLTSPGCPIAETFPSMIENAVKNVPGIQTVTIEIVWDPPWSTDRMSEAAKLELGML